MDRGNRALQDPLNGRMYDIIVMHYSESPKKIGVTDVSSIGGNVSSSSHIDNGTIIKIPIGTKDCGFNNTECYEAEKNETIQGTNNTNPFTVKLPILNSNR